MNLVAASTNTVIDLGVSNSIPSTSGHDSLDGMTVKIISAVVITIIILMFKKLSALFQSKQPLESFDKTLTREQLIHSSRILMVDDEEPLLISELKHGGFSVDHDREGKELHNIENQLYDLAILDYHGVGRHLGNAQGLDLLKHVRRVSPRTRVVAYTSRSLNATESEFFRLSHVVLPKDMGLGDSLNLIECELRKAFSKEHLFEALIAKLAISNVDEKQKIQSALTKALSKNDQGYFIEQIKKSAGSVAEKAVEIIISRLFLNK